MKKDISFQPMKNIDEKETFINKFTKKEIKNEN